MNPTQNSNRRNTVNSRHQIIFGNGRTNHRQPQQTRVTDSSAGQTTQEETMPETPQKPILDRHPEAVAAIESGGPTAISAFMDRVAAVFTRNKKAQATAAAQQRVTAQKAADDLNAAALYAKVTGEAHDTLPTVHTPVDKPMTAAAQDALYRQMFSTERGGK